MCGFINSSTEKWCHHGLLLEYLCSGRTSTVTKVQEMLKKAEKYCEIVINIRQTEVVLLVVMIPMLCGWYKFCKPPRSMVWSGFTLTCWGIRGKVLVGTWGQLGAREAFKAVLPPREVLILL